MSDSCKRDYPVGYGRPPRHSRFKKGQSGNPSGRRRYTQSARGQQLLQQELSRPVVVRENGKTVRMPAGQAILRSVIALAAKGNSAAIREVMKGITAAETAQENAAAPLTITWMPTPEPVTKIGLAPSDPMQKVALDKLTHAEAAELERLLAKARPPE